jgi:hypothetical protein
MTRFCRFCLQELRMADGELRSPNGSMFCSPDDRGVIPADCAWAAQRAEGLEPTMMLHHDDGCACQRWIMHAPMADDRWPWYGQEPGQMPLFEVVA